MVMLKRHIFLVPIAALCYDPSGWALLCQVARFIGLLVKVLACYTRLNTPGPSAQDSEALERNDIHRVTVSVRFQIRVHSHMP